jgi:hypothetical protein
MKTNALMKQRYHQGYSVAYLWCAIQTLVCPCPFSPYLYSHLTYRSLQDEGTSLTSASGSSHMLFPADNFNIFAQFSFF